MRTPIRLALAGCAVALGLSVGLRDASGFAKTIGSDTPIAYDAGASLRYAF